MRLASRQYRYLQALGIEVYKLRDTEDRKQSLKGTDLKSVPGDAPETGAVGRSHNAEDGGDCR